MFNDQQGRTLPLGITAAADLVPAARTRSRPGESLGAAARRGCTQLQRGTTGSQFAVKEPLRWELLRDPH